MTLTAFTSVKGSPGVTTLACLVGGTWPADRRVVVAECDPAGGDLATRFSLSAKTGWLSLTAASRRDEEGVSIEPHLQQLPGGLDVLVAPPGGGGAGGGRVARRAAERALCEFAGDGGADVIVDLGRLPWDEGESGPWLSLASTIGIVLRSDAASIVHVEERGGPIRELHGGKVSLVVVGSGPYSSAEIERFTGIPVVAEIPDEPTAAGVMTLGRGSERRLARSGLVGSARRLVQLLTAGADSARGPVDAGAGDEVASDAPASSSSSGRSTHPGIENIDGLAAATTGRSEAMMLQVQA